MNISLSHNRRRFALLIILLLLTTLIPAGTLAQQEPPPRQNGVAIKASDLAPAPARPAPPAESRTAQPPVVAPSPAPESAPARDVVQPKIQGVVKLDVTAPPTIRASGYITYTYIYTNTSGSTQNVISIKAIWPADVTNSGNVEYCAADLCDVLAGSVQGPTVTRVAPPSVGDNFVNYTVGALTNNSSGRFSVRLRTRADIFPQTGAAPTRPSGSAQLFLNGTNTVVSDDTASALVVGPVLVIGKTATTTGSIYPVAETGTFVISIGNATGPGDVISGNVRADARDGTNVVVRDTFPLGSNLVSWIAPAGTTVVTSSNTLIWTIPLLQVSQTKQITIVYRKADVNNECFTLNNSTYNATSAEYPVPYGVTSSGVAIPVAPTLKIDSVVWTPQNPYFGDPASVTINVKNYWNQPVNGIKLNYDIQTNAYYGGSATPPPTATPPNPSNPGGRVTWTFNMPAGSKTAPSLQQFTLLILGGYTRNSVQNFVAQLVIPAQNPIVPSACVYSYSARVDFIPRLTFTKTASADPSTILGGCYIVHRSDQFEYVLTLTNNGSSNVSGVVVKDLFPTEPGANFSYVVGSAKLNGNSYPPSTFTNGPSGSITWDGAKALSVQSNQTVVLRYSLTVQGFDYYDYHNYANATFNSEEISVPNHYVCVKLNPNIQVEKTIVNAPTNPKPGDQVTFHLRLTNHESIAYMVGLFDLLRSYEYVGVANSYDNNPTVSGNTVEWARQSVGPSGQLESDIITKIPNVCTTTDYMNEVLFTTPNATIQPVPNVTQSVHVTCGQTEYQKSSDRINVSLGDRVFYTLNIHNANGDPVTNVPVDDTLPSTFTFIAMEGTSDLQTAPTQTTQPDGRIKLHWTIPSIAATGTVNIKYFARAGAVVGVYENWVTVPDSANGKCVGQCRTDTNGTYAYYSVSSQPLITTEPSLTPSGCALPGETRAYKLAIVNTNNHNYSSTGVTVTLPLGLWYGGVLQGTPTPTSLTTDKFGVTTVAWSGLTIPAKPAGVFASEVDLEMNLVIGQVWGALDTAAQATSPDGLIPHKDGANDVTVSVCPTDTSRGAISKEVYKSSIKVGDEVVYQISLVNPTGTDISTTVTDQLPANISFVAMVPGMGSPPSSTNPLTWNVTVPHAVNGKPGRVILQFRAHVDSAEVGMAYPNTAASSVPMDTTYATVKVAMPRPIYLPIVAR